MNWSGWINVQEYSPLELFLFIGGCSLWVVVYLIWARNIVRKKFFELPVFAGCADIGWEFTWSFLAVTNMGLFLEWTYRAWFLFDVFLFAGLLLYGWKQYMAPQLRPLQVHIPICLCVTLFWVFAVKFMHDQGLDTPIGARSAYLDQLCISFLYIPFMLRQESLENFSFAAGWLRTLGTGMNTVFMNIHYPEDHFLRLIANTATALDCTYVLLFWLRSRQLARAGEAASATPAVAGYEASVA